ncbi:preprotein translocase subunit SecE [bacterium]|nr:preprotein translocase subunit SecE [bacterium]
MIGSENSNELKFLAPIKTYFKGVRSEWGKITWPQKSQVVSETLFVVVIVFTFTVAVYLMDIIYKGLFGLLK